MRISQIQLRSSHLEILGLELLLGQKILRNTSMIISAEVVILRLMKKLKNLLKDREDHLHHKNTINNRNITSPQLKDQCLMQMMKVFQPSESAVHFLMQFNTDSESGGLFYRVAINFIFRNRSQWSLPSFNARIWSNLLLSRISRRLSMYLQVKLFNGVLESRFLIGGQIRIRNLFLVANVDTNWAIKVDR